MRKYNYCLIRYVADPLRMEPINVGLILQDGSGVQFRFSPHAAKRRDVDTENFRQWRAFFESETKAEVDPLFRPTTDSSEFLPYLARLCDGPILLSRPLIATFDDDVSRQRAFDSLFDMLVLPPDTSSTVDPYRPTNRYRELEDELRLLKRGVRPHAPVPMAPQTAADAGHRFPYRQVANGQYIVIDKIEVARELGRTASELNALGNVRDFLRRFLERQIEGRSTRYVLLADELIEPFTGQSAADFNSMKDDIERTVDIVHSAGGQIIRDAPGAEQFARKLDAELSPA